MGISMFGFLLYTLGGTMLCLYLGLYLSMSDDLFEDDE
jgi:hypothetical protein